MSKENVKLFYNELAKNDALKTKFKVINGLAKSSIPIYIIIEHNYSF
jgi:hypothetical protein